MLASSVKGGAACPTGSSACADRAPPIIMETKAAATRGFIIVFRSKDPDMDITGANDLQKEPLRTSEK
ncbi:hypothetical protein AOE01nite_32100 [Acetobacter oeni]|uniref:Uncharacterized protein n=1 Tax=Acetobacter oeni TaxID=304077 RepID=A0A511XQ14_9PROT|nr:hypothetical protein AA21952_2963 [Acetobacter oeni LMG 21952]GEN64986.1 hypothetical protein AOE01nite_32100 [Acetobacter oeni]